MLIDLHCHTRVYSACSALTPDALIRAAAARGLDGVCLTEHDALWPLVEVQELSREHGLLVLRGAEVTTEAGHVLVYGLQALPREAGTLAVLWQAAREQGALLYLAHPGRDGMPRPDDIPAHFDSVEAANGTDGALQNDNAAAIARRCLLPGIGGSDAHSVREVGICATEFAAEIDDEASFLAALRSGEYRAQRLPRSK